MSGTITVKAAAPVAVNVQSSVPLTVRLDAGARVTVTPTGVPGRQGEPGASVATDPGDFTLLFNNGLI